MLRKSNRSLLTLSRAARLPSQGKLEGVTLACRADGIAPTRGDVHGRPVRLGECVHVPPGFVNDDVERLLNWHNQTIYAELTFPETLQAIDAIDDFLNRAKLAVPAREPI